MSRVSNSRSICTSMSHLRKPKFRTFYSSRSPGRLAPTGILFLHSRFTGLDPFSFADPPKTILNLGSTCGARANASDCFLPKHRQITRFIFLRIATTNVTCLIRGLNFRPGLLSVCQNLDRKLRPTLLRDTAGNFGCPSVLEPYV